MVDGHNAWWGTNNSFDNDESWLDKDNSYNDNTWWWLMKITPGGRTLMKGGTLGNMERRRGERSSNAILTFASFSPLLKVTYFFLSFRSLLVICDPLTIDSLHLHSQVKENNVVFEATDWHEASWAALTQSGVLEWVWQVSTLAPSIFLLSADPLETTSSSNKYHWHCPWSGLQRWVWLEAKLPHVRWEFTTGEKADVMSLPAWPAWPTTRKQTKCTDETLPLKISFNLLPCNKRLLEWLFWVQITEYQKQEGNKNALRKVRLSSLWSKNAKLATNLSWMTSLSQNGKMPTQFLCPESVPYPFGGWLHKKESLFDTFH